MYNNHPHLIPLVLETNVCWGGATTQWARNIATADAEEGAVAGQASPGEAKEKVAVEEEGEAEAGDPHKRQVKEAEKERKGGTPKGKGRGSPDAKGRQLRMTDFKQPACSLSGAEQDSQPPSQQNEARAAPQVVALD